MQKRKLSKYNLKTKAIILAAHFFITPTMQTLTRTIIISFLLISPAIMADSLLDIYHLAKQNDPDIRAAHATYTAGKEHAIIGNAKMKPQVSAFYGYKRAENNIISPTFTSNGLTAINLDTSETNKQWNISATQRLFDAQRWYGAKQAKQLSKQATHQFALAEQNLILRTADAYFNVLRATNNLAVSTAQLDAGAWQLQQAQERFKLGAVAITDVHQAQSSYDLSNALLLNDQAALANTQRNLSYLSGQEHDQLSPLRDAFTANTPVPNDPQAWQALARQHNPSIKLATAIRASAKAAAKAAKSRRLPTVEAELAIYDINNNTDEKLFGRYANQTDGNSIAINVSLPLYMGGELSARKRQAHHEYNRSIEQYAGTVRRVEQQTLSAFSDVTIAVARISAFQQAQTSAKSALDSIELGYENGANSIVDLLSSQRAYFSAQRDYNNAKFDYLLLQLQLEALSGTLSQDNLVTINQFLVR